jgi:hypothetical protein
MAERVFVTNFKVTRMVPMRKLTISTHRHEAT